MSAASDVVMTHFDHHRLSRLLARLRRQGPGRDEIDVDALEEELERATVVDPYQVPASVVTMNTEVEAIFLDNQQSMVFTLAFPAEASPRKGRVSVLAPLGVALLAPASATRSTG